ncbi:MAG TPA: hypothetical protein VJ976_10040 [Ornithinimicrobium sp.]|uniref:hypothetical protein n=1 Tax=Ornithinimicrobium sp. TaxID=1977084 RepID=UPI002B475918|nr:hypothetical protein [Ornithinimicrobium sp.]HKJ12710.1 hypothetical protein [Ornithinimicrobium sp.]
MVRKLAGVGVLLAAVAVLFGALGRSLALSTPAPGQPSLALLQFVVGIISAVLVTIGAILLALAVLASVTRRAPIPGSPPRLLWLGLAVVFASVAAEAGAWWFVGDPNAPWSSWIPLEAAWTLRQVGSAMVAVWLAGRLAHGAGGPKADPALGASTKRRAGR